ncbi:MAG: hypothetical protein P8Y23_10385, partial [Candidatus Lokiarchaeota archaeon]
QKEVENLVDSHIDYTFMGMKTLGAGKIDPKTAYTYISKHNVCCAAIGMVNLEEVNTTTKFALDGLNKKD